VVTLNTCCDIACLTFQVSLITTGYFLSHQRQVTTGSFQSLQHLKKCKKTFVHMKKFSNSQVSMVTLWGMRWASGLQFVFFWDNINDQNYVWIILLTMTLLDFVSGSIWQVRWTKLQYFYVKFFPDVIRQKSSKSVNSHSYSTNNKVDVFWDTVYIYYTHTNKRLMALYPEVRG